MTDIHVTDATFEAEVLGSDVPVLVDFWAAWCGPCRMVAPVLAELAQEYDGRVKIVKVDTEANPVVVGQYGVVSIPLLNVYVGGELVRSLAGARPKQIIAQEIEGVLAEIGGASGAEVGAGGAGAAEVGAGGAAAVADDARGAGAPAAPGPSAVSAQA